MLNHTLSSSKTNQRSVKLCLEDAEFWKQNTMPLNKQVMSIKIPDVTFIYNEYREPLVATTD